MDISIIIVNWNSADYVHQCLASIYCNTTGLTFEVIVVDNASYDHCEDTIKQFYPMVRFIQSHDNLGFAKANNLGYAHSTGDNLLFLNPDTEIVGQSLNILNDYLNKLPDAGAIGCKLLNTDGSTQTSCIQPFPTLVNQILDVEFLRQKLPMLKLWGIRALYETPGSIVPVDVISGACTLVKRSVFQKIEQFSTEYFMYAEDVDLCYKIKRAGYQVYYTGAVTIVHHGGGSSRQKEQTYFGALVMRESLLKFLRKSRGAFYGSLYRISTGIAALCRVFLLSFLLVLTPKETARAGLKMSLGKWVKILRWSLGFEMWTTCLTHEKPSM